MSVQEERPSRTMRRIRDERRKRPVQRSRERVPHHVPDHSSVIESGDLDGLSFDYRVTAQICKNFLCHTLQPDLLKEPLQPACTSPLFGTATAHEFVQNLLRNTRFPESVAFAALFLLHRLKRSGFPLGVGNAYILFLCAYIIAAKVYVDESFCNAYWVILGDRHFNTEELNRCERELCGLLHWNLLVDPLALEQFTEAVKRDFGRDGPYPDYPLDEDLFDSKKRFPQLPGRPVEVEEEPQRVIPPAVPPPEVVAALTKHRKSEGNSKSLPLLPAEFEGPRREILACAGSCARPSATEYSRHPTPCEDVPATWMPLTQSTALKVSGYVLNSCPPV